MKLVKFYSGERISLADLIFASTDTPRLAQGDSSSILVEGAKPRILRGFAASMDQSTLTVSEGAALLTFDAGSSLQPGLFVDETAAAKSFDCSSLAAGIYGAWVTFVSLAAEPAQRVVFRGGNTGFDQDNQVNTRTIPDWSLVVAPSQPSSAHLLVAQVTLPQGTVTDMRPFLFEGAASQGFKPQWGSDADRSAARGDAPISDLETMLAALKTAIEDVKGTAWYERYTAAAGTPGTAGSRFIFGDGPPPADLAPNANDVYFDQVNREIYPAI